MGKILLFFSDNKDSLTAIGILLTFSVSMISLFFTVRNNKAVHYVNAITKNRVEWLYKFREYISDLLCETTIEKADLYAKNKTGYEKQFSEIEKTRNLIHMHLNFSDQIDRDIECCINRLVEHYKDLYDLSCFYYEKENENGINLTLGHTVIYPIVRKIIAKYLGVAEFAIECYFPFYDNEDEKEKLLAFFNEEASRYFHEIERYRAELMKHVRVYLKFEWNRIKIEATGRRYRKKKQTKDIGKLYDLYGENSKEID